MSSNPNLIRFTAISGKLTDARGALLFRSKPGVEVRRVVPEQGNPYFEIDLQKVATPEEALAIKKEIYTYIKQTYMQQDPPKVKVDPPYERKGFDTDEDIEEKKIDEFKEQFNYTVVMRRDNREDVKSGQLPPPTKSPLTHMLLDPSQRFGDQDSGYLSLFKATDYMAMLSIVSTVQGGFIHFILLPPVREEQLTDDHKGIIKPEDFREEALLLNTEAVTKLLVETPEGQLVPDQSGIRSILTHEYLFCGKWPEGTEELTIDIANDKESYKFIRDEYLKQFNLTELNLEDPAAFIYKLLKLKAIDEAERAEKEASKEEKVEEKKEEKPTDTDVVMKDSFEHEEKKEPQQHLSQPWVKTDVHRAQSTPLLNYQSKKKFTDEHSGVEKKEEQPEKRARLDTSSLTSSAPQPSNPHLIQTSIQRPSTLPVPLPSQPPQQPDTETPSISSTTQQKRPGY